MTQLIYLIQNLDIIKLYDKIFPDLSLGELCPTDEPM